jgi:outer membrane protein assembly complex protein YaeT
MRRPAAALALGIALVTGGCGREAAQGRPWIHDVKFVGVKSVKPRQLKKRLALEETSWVPFAPKHYLDPFTIDTDRARIEAFYRARGYFTARVTNAEVIPRKKGDSVDVKITVDEGPPSRIHAVEIGGLEVLPRGGKRLIKEFNASVKQGEILNHDKYLEAKERIKNRLLARGYAWVDVQGQVEVNRDTQAVDIKIAVKPGPRTVFGHVHVRGTERVKPRLLEVHSGIRQGSRFDPQELENARGAIYNLGLFSSVRVEVEPSSERPDVAEVIVSVKESTFNELRVGLGVGLESQRTDAHAAFSYARRNFLGGLRTLRLRVEPAWVAIPAFWNVQRTGPAILAEASLTQPDVIWPHLDLKWTVGYDVGIEYAYQYHGPRTSLGVSRPFWRNRIILGLSYNFQFLDFFATDPAILNDPAQAGTLFGYVDPYRIGWWQQDFVLDLRDKPLDAHQGVYVGIVAEEGGIYAAGAFSYEKIVPEVRAYAPLGSRLTAAARVQFGQLFPHGDTGSPITRRFYLGGPNNHRGFNYNRLSQQVPSGTPGIPPLPIGGDQMVLAQFELRLNIVEIAKNWLSIAAFFDAGDVAPPTCFTPECRAAYPRSTIDFTQLHYATGGGLRLKTVIGTIRFDLGVRLNRLDATQPDGTPNPDPGQRFAFHISVGEAF